MARASKVNVGDIFPTKQFGDIEILEKLPKGIYSFRFLDTGFERTSHYGNIMKGALVDYSSDKKVTRNRASKYKVGMTFQSKYNGPYEIIETLPDHKARIRFERTGGEVVIKLCNVTRGKIRDPLATFATNEKYKIKVGSIYDTNFYGRVVIIDRISTTVVKVRFLDTGFEREVLYSNLLGGKVRDTSIGEHRSKPRNYGMKLDVGSKFKNTQGHEFEVVEFSGHKDVRIRFTNTGTERITSTQVVITGRILDYMEPSVCGIGYLGTADYHLIPESIKVLWRGMMKRVADPDKPNTLCERWHSLKDFAEDVPSIPNYSEWLKWKEGYSETCIHLDKDFLDPGNTEYAPGKVIFISEADNTTEAMLRHYKDHHKGTDIGYHMEEAHRLLREKVMSTVH